MPEQPSPGGAAKRPKQHWIPAVVLAQFSVDQERPRPRDRRLHVQLRQERCPRVVAAKNLAYERGLYDRDENGPFGDLPLDMLDDSFNPYERRLPNAIGAAASYEERLGTHVIPLEPWLRTLVPYIAGLTVRSPIFLSAARESFDNILMQESRLTEMTRALAPLMAADWHALVTPSGTPFIINDRGYTWTRDIDNDRVGVLVPMTSTLCLAVLPTPERTFAVEDDGEWFTSMPTRTLSGSDVADINKALARTAVEWAAGANAAAVSDLAFDEPDLETPALGYSWPDRGPLGTHDRDWSTAMQLAGFNLDDDDWHPFAILSGTEPGVRMGTLDGRSALEISFLRPQDPGLALASE